MQSCVLQQLNGTVFSGDESAEQRRLTLQHAMGGQKVLLVIDDCWDPEHEKLLNLINADNGSKVLLSSRIHGVVEGDSPDASAIVTIQLPSEEDAIRMLASTAGLPKEGALPKQARDLVKSCKLLPLSISIAQCVSVPSWVLG